MMKDNRHGLVELAKEKLNQEYIEEGLTLLEGKGKVETTVRIGREKIVVTLEYMKEHEDVQVLNEALSQIYGDELFKDKQDW